MKKSYCVLLVILFSFCLNAEKKKKEDKIFNRKITDTSKKLEIRSGDLTDTKAMLRKTDFPNPEQVRTMKKILASELGSFDKYKIAARKSPASINVSLNALWEIYLRDEDLKETNKELKKKDLTKGLKKYYSEKKEKLQKEKSSYNSTLDKNLAFMKKLIESEAIASKGEYFVNEVAHEDGVDLIDKLGDAKTRLKKGTSIKTKVHPKDASFYLVEYDGEILFAKRGYFKLK
ncbi:MAG: hypothetical protein NE328_20055 [Lentisphaeraceae bacterium]|nr:hypothetical protein [Lentisphaeraceae bacterium]